MQNSKIEIILLPTSQWRRYKIIRLEALKEEPQAFGESYETALAKPDDFWIERVAEAEEGKHGLMYFAECDGQLVGTIGTYFNKTPDSQRKAHIVGMYVNKNYRGRGIARLLMETVLNRLQTVPDIDVIKLHVNVDRVAALKLYESFGFTIVGREDLMFGDGKQHEAYWMEKEL